MERRISESTSSITLKNSQGYIHLVSVLIDFDNLDHKMLNISIDWCVAAIMKDVQLMRQLMIYEFLCDNFL